MASTKKTRQEMSRRCQTIVLRDLQCLHKWREGLSKHNMGHGQPHSNWADWDHLLCDESLEDLEDVWPAPARGKRAKKAWSKRKTSQLISEESEDVWAMPIQGKRAKRTISQLALPQTSTPVFPASRNIVPLISPASGSVPLISPASGSVPPISPASGSVPPISPASGSVPPISPASVSVAPPISPASRRVLLPISPASGSVVPPNSPAELSPAGQTASNPYIAYLIQSWEASSPLVAQCRAQSNKSSGDTACGDEDSSPVLVSLQQDEVNVMLIHADDVLIIPDSSGQALTSPIHTAHSGQGEEPAQCVPQDEDEESSQSQCQEISQQSLFDENGQFVEDGQNAEDGFITSLSPQQTLCQQDHVVPKFELEE